MDEESRRIGVMLASRRHATVFEALLRRLASEPGVGLAAAPVHDPACLPDRLAAAGADVLLLDQELLSEVWIHRLARRGVRVLLACDVPTDALSAILAHRFDGFVLTADPPDVMLKALRAVCTGDLWLPRAMLAHAVRHGMPAALAEEPAAAAVKTPEDCAGVLTRRESQVVERLRRGFTNKEIGRELGIMEDTVKKHLQSIFGKLGVHRRGLVMLGHAPASLDDR
jgi:DNA-binding NarL/FixJ family response regulator